MPIYDYRCQSCDTTFEAFFRTHQKMTAGKVTCPACGAKRVRRLMSAVRTASDTTSRQEHFDHADHEASTAPGANGLLGRKEINAITAKRKKAGLPG